MKATGNKYENWFTLVLTKRNGELCFSRDENRKNANELMAKLQEDLRLKQFLEDSDEVSLFFLYS